MPGSPRKRAIQEREAIKRTEILAQQQATEKALELPKAHVKYSPAIVNEIIGLISNGIPIDDSILNGAVVAPGIATRMGIHPSTFYEWQQQHDDFAGSVALAREESSHRIADRMLSLADVALSEPAMANAVRVAADILKWSAAVRNRQTYGEQQRLEVAVASDLGDRLRRANQRVIEDCPPVMLASPDSHVTPNGSSGV